MPIIMAARHLGFHPKINPWIELSHPSGSVVLYTEADYRLVLFF